MRLLPLLERELLCPGRLRVLIPSVFEILERLFQVLLDLVGNRFFLAQLL